MRQQVDVGAYNDLSGDKMIDVNPFQGLDLPQNIKDVLREHWQVSNEGQPVPMHDFEIAQYAAATLLNWKRPATLALAMLLVPLLEHHRVSQERLITLYPAEALALAQQLKDWHTSNASLDQANTEIPSTYHSMLLRRLLRQAYLNLPDISFVLLVMAEHHTQLMLEREKVAALTHAVFVPMAGIVGMWNIRRQWLDASLSFLFKADYDEIARLMREVGLFAKEQKSGHNDVPRESSTFSDSVTGKKQYKAERKVASERDQAFHVLKTALQPLLQEKEIDATVRPVELTAGTFLNRCRNGDVKEELIKRLRVRIECRSEQDCYRVLGIVHTLGKPLSQRLSEWFRDYIAVPQSNGYRALHTTIYYQYKKGSFIPAEFGILTRAMYNFNEMGILADAIGEQEQNSKAWWNALPEHSDAFCRRKAILERPIGTRSDTPPIENRSGTIYVFTPHGEVVYQKDGNTALDFAYHIHTELGHHAARIEVNCKSVPYNYPLHNGDWVHVTYDPYVEGPDWFWLSSVSTTAAKHKIRQGLVTRAGSIHEGRRQVESILLNIVQGYQKEKHYHIRMSTRQLDSYLFRAAQAFHLPDRETLYEEIVKGRVSPEKLAQRFVWEELAALIVDERGNALPYPSHAFHFCISCRPVPGEPLIAFEKQLSLATHCLKIHHLNSPCVGKGQRGKVISIRWVDQATFTPKNKERMLLQIGCTTRYRLLGDIINVIYKMPGVRLQGVDAPSSEDGTIVDVTLLIEIDSFARAGEAQAQIENIQGVRYVSASLPTLSQLMIRRASTQEGRILRNPYTYQEVYDRLMFYDREPFTESMLNWLKEPSPTNRLILHGQRRVGKTSLAKYFIHEILPEQRLAHPVWIDFQDLSDCSPQSIAHLLVQSVCGSLHISPPAREAQEEPMLWVNRVLEYAVVHLQPRRLLVVIDEFNVLLDIKEKKLLLPLVLHNLRSMMAKRRDLHWLLIVQDTHFYDPIRYGEAGDLFQHSRLIQLPHLDRHWANLLITEPAQRCGVEIEAATANKIFDLTNGNPYLIQKLCYELLDRLIRQRRQNITLDDLDHVTNQLVNATDGLRTFHHFMHYLDSVQKIVLAMVASLSRGGSRVSIADVKQRIYQKDKRLSSDTLYDPIKKLVEQGIFALEVSEQGEQVYIPIKLFHTYVEDNMTVQKALDEWKATRSTRTRREGRS